MFFFCLPHLESDFFESELFVAVVLRTAFEGPVGDIGVRLGEDLVRQTLIVSESRFKVFRDRIDDVTVYYRSRIVYLYVHSRISAGTLCREQVLQSHVPAVRQY